MDRSIEPLQGGWHYRLAGPAVLFFGLVPLLLGFVLGATRAGIALHLPWAIGIAFWVITSVGTWICFYGGSALAGIALRPWQPPLWLILIAGAVIGSVPARYIVYGTAGVFGDQMTDGRTPRSAPPFEWSADFVLQYLQGWIGAYLTWVALGLIFDRWFGIPRYSREARGLAPQASAAVAPAVPAAPDRASDASLPAAPLLERLPAKIGRNVLALEAEDHYVRVYTDQGSTLLLARLSDAIADLQPIDGIRVHRSYWVRRDAVEKVTVHGKGLMLKLSNGIDVPVSQAYKELARKAGIVRT